MTNMKSYEAKEHLNKIMSSVKSHLFGKSTSVHAPCKVQSDLSSTPVSSLRTTAGAAQR